MKHKTLTLHIAYGGQSAINETSMNKINNGAKNPTLLIALSVVWHFENDKI